jgi:hypothetical protein
MLRPGVGIAGFLRLTGSWAPAAAWRLLIRALGAVRLLGGGGVEPGVLIYLCSSSSSADGTSSLALY